MKHWNQSNVENMLDTIMEISYGLSIINRVDGRTGVGLPLIYGLTKILLKRFRKREM